MKNFFANIKGRLHLTKNKLPFFVLLLLIFFVGILVRSYQFGYIPGGLNQDEASGAYDAFSLLRFGIDRHGYTAPAFFVAWGNGMHALPYYSSIPFIFLFGLNPFSIRIASLIVNILSLFAFFFMVRKMAGEKVALLAIFLLSIAPWHILISRWNHEFCFFPPVFLLGFASYILFESRKYLKLLSPLLISLSIYTYGPALFFAPVFFVLLTLYLLFWRKLNLYELLMWITVFVITAMPALLFILINQYQLSAIELPFFSIPLLKEFPRYAQIGSGIFGNSSLQSAISNIQSLWHLLEIQSDGLIYNAIPKYGFYYKYSTFFIILGALILLLEKIRAKEFNYNFLIFLWLITAIALAAVMPTNSNRINIIFFPLTYLLALGLSIFLRHYKILLLILGLYLYSFIGFVHTYFTTYPSQIGQNFFASLGDAIADASQDTNQAICITDRVNRPDIYVLLHNKIDPHIFIKTVQYVNPNINHGAVRSFDRYIFGLDSCPSTTNIFVVDNNELSRFNMDEFDKNTYSNYSVLRRKQSVKTNQDHWQL